jgi:YggT family protein
LLEVSDRETTKAPGYSSLPTPRYQAKIITKPRILSKEDLGLMFLASIIINFLQIYSVILIVRILLTWFQTAGWASQTISFLSPITDPYLNIFRSFIPPLGGIDFSPILAFMVLSLVQGLIQQAAYSL